MWSFWVVFNHSKHEMQQQHLLFTKRRRNLKLGGIGQSPNMKTRVKSRGLTMEAGVRVRCCHKQK